MSYKKISLLFLIISAALFSTSFAGRVRKSVLSNIVSTSYEDLESWEAVRHDEESEIHGRVLKVKTNDYGRYDPSPSFVKPPFKLIPN
ncbi:protein CASPARIAN STRIP INTEGRITY FACTOR 1-like [Salvia splendens]|uniref:protein CASPARIAN STRIP INTEGRITY FACTOR 1-like n=1 Tax=Salvia splendens TaxID=180675 RepID=UPI001C256914|nr:protein CASPARIAN STRIP INTEGRITY FACTOR 1-like [Salvia splendens]